MKLKKKKKKLSRLQIVIGKKSNNKILLTVTQAPGTTQPSTGRPNIALLFSFGKNEFKNSAKPNLFRCT